MDMLRTSLVGDEPEIELILWSIWRTERSELHLVGVRPTTMTGRVSSAISSLDRAARIVMTKSGRRYRLIGPRGRHDQVSDVWKTWCVKYRVLWAVDVTEDTLSTAPLGERP